MLSNFLNACMQQKVVVCMKQKKKTREGEEARSLKNLAEYIKSHATESQKLFSFDQPFSFDQL